MAAQAVRESLNAANAVTMLRLAAVPLIIWLLIAGLGSAAVVVYILAGLTDLVDGWLARRLGQVTDLGTLLDPLVDRIFIIAVLVSVAAVTGSPPWWAVGVLIGRDAFLLIGFRLVERQSGDRLPVSFIGKVSSTLLMVSLALLMAEIVGADLVFFGALVLALLTGLDYLLKGMKSLTER